MKLPREVTQAVEHLNESAELLRQRAMLFFIALEKHGETAAFFQKPLDQYSPAEIFLLRICAAVLFTDMCKGGLAALKEEELGPVRERVLERRRQARSMRPK